ncbi:MAG: glycogen synthase GlgA [Anaerovibrio sp.]|uniref:glycogen synthase GlgA n=1 Tax=Anaerovibrio sp. TaxID=1872532 RepID=UPI0025EBCFF2|nr:glycogen synthase GlgA [Anaerovibrio sp.]MCR5176758.1 glycogen synthase GlgA [Anaerovibrio sp.]
MKVLYVVSEAVPFVKTGGLADVAGSLPKALVAEGIDARVILPKYSNIPEEYRNKMEHVADITIPVSWRQKYAGVEKLVYDGVTYYFIDNEEYFRRDGMYGYGDDAERFSFFSRAVLNLLPAIDFWPDIINSNDWHAALVNVLLKLEHNGDSRYENIKTVFSIHNLKYQGIFDKNVMGDVLGLDWQYFNNGDLEFNDSVNFMKGGIIYADYITTVSRTYAKEIQYPYFGENLDGLLRTRSDSLRGIVNGIDTDVYNPATDKYLFENFDETSLEKKLLNKEKLQAQLGLPVGRNIPLLGMVSRLVEAKGLSLIIRIMDEILVHENCQFVLLGTGDKEFEDWFRDLQWRHPTKVSSNIFFSNELAQKIYGSADMFLMPSIYEPCGIGQLISLRYGTVPIVRETGGLKDTVKAFNKYDGTGNGYTFSDINAHDLMYSIKRALTEYENMGLWSQIRLNAIHSDYGWDKSAKEYIDLYNQLLGK